MWSFQEQFPETNLSMEQMQELAKTLLITTKSHNESISAIKKKERKHDRKLEELINNAVAKYFKGTVILSGYKYKTADGEDGELDGMIVGVNEEGKNTVVFVETKSDMNSKWDDTTKQMHRTLLHWNYLKELYTADDIETQKEDIKNFQ